MRTRIIDGREAAPVRLIPFIAGWREFAPDGVAKVLSSGKDGYGFEVELTAYHQLSDGTYKAMLPREWDAVATYLEVLTKKLKKEDKKEQIKMLNSEAWRKQSIEKLPSFAFVWLDDFKTAFNEVMSRTTFAAYDGEMGEAVPTERPGDKELNLSAPMTFDEMETVFAEFPLPYPHEEIAKLEAELNRPNQVGYTIRGAAAALSKKYGIDENSVRDSLFEATKHGKLPVRKTESGFTYTPRVRRDFLERVSIDDLNSFFEAEGVSYRLGDKLETAPPVVNGQQDANKDQPRVMKKAALITKLEAEGFVNVESSFRHADTNGLHQTAKSGEKYGFWRVKATIEWFEQRQQGGNQTENKNLPSLEGYGQLKAKKHVMK